jgi:hypothetical protein
MDPFVEGKSCGEKILFVVTKADGNKYICCEKQGEYFTRNILQNKI